jgi:tetratricopeptide (TPR) repeat protein
MMEGEEPKKSMDTGNDAISNPPDAELSPADYLRAVKNLLAKGGKRDACELLQPALIKYPDDPFLLSYYGYLSACFVGKYRNGVESCKRAITLFEKKGLRGENTSEQKIYAVLYLNLGRACLAGGKKKDAIDALHKGLYFDKQNKELQAEVTKLGIRKYVPISFLDRSNPINAFFGKLLRKTDK